MNYYLSFGGGVNSTALMIWLHDHGMPFEAVYADHGADWPETTAYVAMLQAAGWPITVLHTTRQGHNLYDFFLAHHIIPMRTLRHCTVHFKIRPLLAYFKRPCVTYMGISYDERHRCRESSDTDTEYLWPLVDEQIDRAGCVSIIEGAGLPVPPKSGCYICPFQRRSQWRLLRISHPDLYARAVALEDRANEVLREKGGKPIYLADPLPVRNASQGRGAQPGQTDMLDEIAGASCVWCEVGHARSEP